MRVVRKPIPLSSIRRKTYESERSVILVHKLNEWFHLRPWKRHSLVLLVTGLVYVFIGIAYITTGPRQSRTVALQIALDWWSLDVWGGVFILSGLLAILSSRWPPFSETWGYFVLTGLSAGWSGFYATGVIFGDSPTSNLNGALSWGLIAFLWWAISGLTNPTTVILEHVSPSQTTEQLNEALREADHSGHDKHS
jgi:hypothetical protein